MCSMQSASAFGQSVGYADRLDMRLALVALFALASLAACAPSHEAQTPHNAASAQLESETVALVMQARSGGLRAYCAGVWVAEDEILTANHCVDDSDIGERLLYVVRGDVLTSAADEAQAVRFGVLAARDTEHDLALVRVKLAPAHAVAGVSSPSVGQNVQTMGHPLGLWWSYSTGQVAAIRQLDDNGVWYVQATAPISPGNSGGGLFDSDGNLLGLCHAYMPRGENVNFYIDARYIESFLREAAAS